MILIMYAYVHTGNIYLICTVPVIAHTEMCSLEYHINSYLSKCGATETAPVVWLQNVKLDKGDHGCLLHTGVSFL